MDPMFTVRAASPVQRELERMLAETEIPAIEYPIAAPAFEAHVPDEDLYDSQILAGLVAP